MIEVPAGNDINVNTTAIKLFLNHDTTKPVSSTEFIEFYKACTVEERQAFGDAARTAITS